MRQIFRDSKLQSTYDPVGHALVELLSPAEVQGLLAELATLKPDDNFEPLHTSGNGLTFHCSFLDANRAYRRQVHALISRYFSGYIDRILNGYRILNANFYVKPPNWGEFVIHQNWPAISDIDDTTVTLWCPLVDVEERNGALQVVSASHKILPHVEGVNNPPYFTNFRQALIDKYLKPIPMKAGQGIIFDDGLIHWSAKNDSDHPRIAIQILCIPIDSTPAYWYFDEHDPDHFELIEADSEFFLTNDAKDLSVRQAHWRSLGFAPNHNRLLSEEEFAELLANGDKIRRKLYEHR